jgi:hypothetical protein
MQGMKPAGAPGDENREEAHNTSRCTNQMTHGHTLSYRCLFLPWNIEDQGPERRKRGAREIRKAQMRDAEECHDQRRCSSGICPL